MMKTIDEEESRGRGGERKKLEGGPIILLFNPLKVEAHQSESTYSNDSCLAFIKV